MAYQWDGDMENNQLWSNKDDNGTLTGYEWRYRRVIKPGNWKFTINEGLMRKSSINRELSSVPCLITGECIIHIE